MRRCPVLVALRWPNATACSEDGLVVDVVPGEGECFAGSEAGVGEHGDQRCVPEPFLVEHVLAHRFDGGGCKRADRLLALLRWFLDCLGGVAGQAAPFDGAFEHALQEDEGAADRVGADAGPFELLAEAGDGFGGELAQLVAAESAEGVGVPEGGLGVLGCFGEVGDGVELEPFLGVFGEGLAAGGQGVQVAELFSAFDFGVVEDGVGLAVEVAGAVVAGFAPVDTPDGLGLAS